MKKKTNPQKKVDIVDSDYSSLKNIQKLTISELVEKYAYSQAIVETVREPLVVLDAGLHVKSVNDSFLRVFQVTKKETIGKKLYNLNGGEWDIPELKKLLENILPKNSHFNDFEVNHNFSRLGQKTMLLNARRIVLEGNKTQMILLAIEDITEHKAIQQQKEDFVNMVSHELKTPITSMTSYLQILQRRIKDMGDEKNSYLLAMAERQTNKLTQLLDEILHVGKIDSGTFVLNKKEFDINTVIERVISDFDYMFDTHTILRKGVLKQKVYGDADRIEQVLINLLSNAVKYSTNENDVVVRVSKKRGNAVVGVQDFGPGIDKKDISRIFDRYYNVKNTDEAKGFGLGLYISSVIVKRHDGSIWVESAKGKGSTFFFSLPLK